VAQSQDGSEVLCEIANHCGDDNDEQGSQLRDVSEVLCEIA